MLQPKKKAVISVPKTRNSEIKEHNSREDYTLPYSMRQRKDTPEEIAAAREQRILASQQARTVSWSKDNWRDKLAMETSATGDKLSLQQIPGIGKYVPSFLDATKGIGDMASSLGSAPLRAKKENSNMPYLTAVGAPLVAGALGGIGSRSTAGFVNNVVNPFAGSGLGLIRGKNAVKRAFKGRLTKASAVQEIKRGADSAVKGLAKGQSKNKVIDEVSGTGTISSTRENVRHIINDSAFDAPLPTSRARTPDQMRNDLLAFDPSEETQLRIDIATDAEVAAEHATMNRSNTRFNLDRSQVQRNREQFENAPRTLNSDESYAMQAGIRRNDVKARRVYSDSQLKTDISQNELNGQRYLPPTKKAVVSQSLKSIVQRPKQAFKNIAREFNKAAQTGALKPKSIYYNTQNALAGDSKQHTFMNMTPKAVSDKVDGVMNSIPKGGQFGEKSLSSDSFRLMTPKMGASKDFKIINTGKLQPLNGMGNKENELFAKFGYEEGASKTAELMNSYIARLERSTGKKITKAKVIDGQVYVPQLLAHKKGGSFASMVNRSKDQIVVAGKATIWGGGGSYFGAKLKESYDDNKELEAITNNRKKEIKK